MNLVSILKKFLMQNADSESTLLLGLSGGSDSMALFHLLIHLQKTESIKFAVAHVNHNWRQSSTFEAESLKKMALEANLPFHLLNLKPEELKGNLELACRNERLNFFKKLCDEFSYRGVLLGHHLDDRAETVLKRLLEGATLNRLGALKNIAVINGLTIFRPLLDFRKSEILKWLENQSVTFFQDSTNLDPKFMRARFRTKIIPFLNEEFGKDIREPLNRIGLEAFELDEYLSQHLNFTKYPIVRGDCGSYLDFSNISSRFAMKYLIRKFAESEGFFISYPLVDQACCYIKGNSANKRMSIGGKNLYFDRKKMFILSDFVSGLLDDPLNVSCLEIDTENTGTFYCGPWKLDVKKNFFKNENKISWQNAFKGIVQYSLPAGKYLFKSPEINEKYRGEISLSSLWTNYKVPAFLRKVMPVVKLNGTVYVEFLSGKSQFFEIPEGTGFTIIIQYNGLIALRG
jgi:tRNA(Ile)-lysidine synthase